MTRTRAWAWIKTFALLAAVAFMIHYVVANAARLQAYPFSLEVWALLLAALVLLAGKILIVAAAALSLASLGEKSDFIQLARLYSISQLGKYVPGGLWQFVGRGIGYHTQGMTAHKILAALALENGALILGSFWFGYLVLLGAGVQWMSGLVVYAWVLGLLLTALYLFAQPPRQGWLANQVPVLCKLPAASRRYRALLLLLQGGIWGLLGLSFYFVLLGVGIHSVPVAEAAGAFSVSWLTGFLAVFVPGGIGVREGMLGFLLKPQVAAPVAFVGAVVGRIVWVVIEVVMIGLSHLLRARSTHSED